MGSTHSEWKAKRSVVWLEAHRPALLQDGLVGRMQALANRRWGIVVIMVSRGRVVVVVHGLVSINVLLLSKEVRVEISVKARINKSSLK